ncbi:hypothetical protein PAXINDRAFT_9849 [Paxillus involutus ATCC 200175]|nr:hypothetical protein PAXINDRAFT_9849 [Paxillus involutus ATCC 200175]
MAELVSPAGTLPFIPDDFKLAHFILDFQHPSRPIRRHGVPWIIEDHTGKTLGYEEVRPDGILHRHVHKSYGTTESSAVITICSLDKRCDLSGSAGQLLPGITARVEKPDGTLADFDEPGELVVKTPSVALGYAGNSEVTRETFVNGWLRTGDEVRMNRRGEIFVLDHLKEMLKVRGFQVAPAELEGCILDHADVADTCVVGERKKTDYNSELPFAFVVLRHDAAKRVVTGCARNQAVDYEARRRQQGRLQEAGGVEFIDVVPKNSSGKLLRRVLRDKAREMRLRPAAKL